MVEEDEEDDSFSNIKFSKATQYCCTTCGNNSEENFVIDQKSGDTICVGVTGGLMKFTLAGSNSHKYWAKVP